MNKDTAPSFEQSFAQLQELISKLESTELPLEEALKLYEEGKRLSRVCASMLEAAQLRVETLGQEANVNSPDE